MFNIYTIIQQKENLPKFNPDIHLLAYAYKKLNILIYYFK